MKLAIRTPASEWGPIPYDQVSHSIDIVIAENFGLPFPAPFCVKQADIMAAAIEKRDVMIRSDWEWPDLPKPLAVRIFPVGPVEAELMFLQRYVQLFGA
jgi:hypothetical protein